MKNKKVNSILDARIEASNAEGEIDAQVADILQKLDGKVYEWLLITVQHDFPCEGAPQDEREDLMQDLANALTCHCAPVAIRRGEIACQPVLPEFQRSFGESLPSFTKSAVCWQFCWQLQLGSS